jgi:hypothetical protein
VDEQEDTAEAIPPVEPTPPLSTPVTPKVPEVAPEQPGAPYSGEAGQPPMTLPYPAAPITPPYALAPPFYLPPPPPYALLPQAYVPPPPGPAPALPLAPVYPTYYGGYHLGRPEHPSRTAAIIVETILDLFGIFGVGWLIAGETTTGIILLVASCLWWSVAVLITIFTVGIGLICILPLDLIFLLLSVILLAQRTAARAY